MNGPQRPSDRAGWPGLASTDPDRTEDGPDAPAPAAGPAADTGEFTPVPSTGHATDQRADGPDTAPADGETRSFVGSPLPDTAPPEAGGTTDDATADGIDRGATASFQLAPALEGEDTERTTAPPEGSRATDCRWSRATMSSRCWARAAWGSCTRRGSPGSTASSPSR